MGECEHGYVIKAMARKKALELLPRNHRLLSLFSAQWLESIICEHAVEVLFDQAA